VAHHRLLFLRLYLYFFASSRGFTRAIAASVWGNQVGTQGYLFLFSSNNFRNFV
jgi:hypothetical protein